MIAFSPCTVFPLRYSGIGATLRPRAMSASLLNYRPSPSAVYYRPPKRLEFRRTLFSLVTAAVAVVVGAALYAKILPQLSHLAFRGGAVVAAAIAIGVAATAVVRYGKVCSPIVAASIGTSLSLLALYAMWVTWLHDVVAGAGGTVGYLALVRHPVPLWLLLRAVGETGTWEYTGATIKGVALFIIWVGEAGIMLAAGVFSAIKSAGSAQEICLACGTPCTSAGKLPRFAADRQTDMIAAIENRDFAAVASHPAPQHEDAPELSLRLVGCSQCGQTQILTLNHLAWTLDSNYRAVVAVTPLVNRLLITPEEAEYIKALDQQITDQRTAQDAAPPDQPPPPADEPGAEQSLT